MMSAARGRNTRLERRVRSELFAAGYRYHLHRRDLPGAPDIVLPRYRIAVLVHGCFGTVMIARGGAALPRVPNFGIGSSMAILFVIV